jgi:hypothetical protein
LAEEQDILLREIDEELKQENLQKIWKKYGAVIIVSSVVLVGAVAGYKGWQAYDLDQRITQGEHFAAAQLLASKEENTAARNAFGKIAKNSTTGYTMLARFQLAALAVKNGDPYAAVDSYQVLADDLAVDEIYRELAVVLGALVELESKTGSRNLTARAENLAQGSGPWRFSAKEVSALAALKKGDNKTVRMRYDELSKDAAVPQGLRTRASEMLHVLSKN